MTECVKLKGNALLLLKVSQEFLEEELLTLEKERGVSLFLKCVSWIPLANLAIAYTSLAKSTKSYEALTKSVKHFQEKYMLDIEQSISLSLESSYNVAFAEFRLYDSRVKAKIATQYFLQTVSAVISIAFIIFGGSATVGTTGLIITWMALHKVLGLNFRLSKAPRPELIEASIYVVKQQLKNVTKTLSEMIPVRFSFKEFYTTRCLTQKHL